MSDEIGGRGLFAAREAVNRDTPELYEFGPFRLEPAERKLLRGNELVVLTPKAFDMLVLLVRNSGHLLEKEELIRMLWPDTFVEEGNLSNNIFLLRKALGEDPPYIKTVPKRGYRFVGALRQLPNAVPLRPEKPLDGQSEFANEVPTDRRLSDRVVGIPSRDHRRWRTLLAIAASASAMVAIAAALWWRSSTRYPTSLKNRTLTRLTFDDGLQIGATWSPDGRYIAYSSDRGGKFDVWVQQVSGGDPVQITKGPGHHWQPNWSPDGKYIAYRSEEAEGGLYIVPALGGAGLERKIAAFGYYPRWSPDSSQILVRTMFTPLQGPNRFYLVGLDGTPPREVFGDLISQLAQTYHYAVSAAWHPDGKRVTLWVRNGLSLWTLPIAGGSAVKSEVSPELAKQLDEASGATSLATATVRDADYDFAWAPSGSAVYSELTLQGAGNIWRRTIDPKTLQPIAFERLTTDPGFDTELAISPDGKKLAFTAATQHIRTWLYPFDASLGRITGPGQAVTSQGTQAWLVNLSRDGKKLAFCVDRGGDFQLREMSLSDAREMPIFPDDSYWRQYPQWSPDGTRLAYTRDKNGENQIMVWSSQSRNEEPLTTPTQNAQNAHWVYDWSPDGEALLVSQRSATGNIEVWQIPAVVRSQSNAAAHRIISEPGFDVWQPHFSPDGRWILFEAVSNAQSSLYVVPAVGGAWIRITEGRHWDDKPRWSPDGKMIYFVSAPGGFFNVWGIHFDPSAGRPVGRPFRVTAFENPSLAIPNQIQGAELSLTQDRLAVTLAQVSGNVWMLDNLDP